MKSYIIPSLMAAGFVSPDVTDAKQLAVEDHLTSDKPNFWNLMEGNLPVTLAAHSSHASHGSHGSHRSSATPRYIPPAPAPMPNSSPKVKQKPNNATPPNSILPDVRGGTEQFKRITMRVQMYLYAFGFYTGEISGLDDMDTKSAIVKYQASKGLAITGQIDNNLLKSMNVSTE
jgi:His-Xaa-Ser repeat protein HxsA